MKKKILVITGTRAEYGILRSVMDAISAHEALELRLLVTGMHTQAAFGDTQQEVAKDYSIDCVVPVPEGADMLNSLTREIDGIREFCLRDRPDCVLVLGDRDEMLAGALVAAHLNIPLAHIHGGDITGVGVDDKMRHAITKFAHLHFPGTDKAAERLKAMGEPQDRIFSIGTPVIDMLENEALLSREDLAKELALDEKREWMTFVQHPVAFDAVPLEKQITESLSALEAFPEHEKIVLYPNNDTGSEVFISTLKKLSPPRYHVLPSLPRVTYLSAVKESVALVGNSSAGIIETAHLGTPAVDIGDRQSGRERGDSVLHASYDAREIANAISRTIEMKKGHQGAFPSPYGKPGAGMRIAEILAKELGRAGLLTKQYFL